jgi:DinB superfamily
MSSTNYYRGTLTFMAIGDAHAQRLERAVDQLITSARLLGQELYHRPGEREWSAMENLAHVAEFVPFWAVRARDFALGRLRDEPFGRAPEEWDQRAAAVAAHGNDSLEPMVDRLKAGLTTAVAALRSIPDDRWSVVGSLEVNGPRQSVAELVEERVLSHVEAHVRQAADAGATALKPGAGSRPAATG